MIVSDNYLEMLEEDIGSPSKRMYIKDTQLRLQIYNRYLALENENTHLRYPIIVVMLSEMTRYILMADR